MKGKILLQLLSGILLSILGFGMVYDSILNEIYIPVPFLKGIVLGNGAVIILWGIREIISSIYKDYSKLINNHNDNKTKNRKR